MALLGCLYTKISIPTVNNYQNTTEKQVSIVIFCRDLTQAVVLLEIARSYLCGDMLERPKRLSTQKPRFLQFGEVDVNKGIRRGKLGISL